jgi:uncharacterized protein DUF1707
MDDQLRVSDTEREQAAAALGDHYVAGRLSAEEHAERVDAVWSARTRGDLADLFRDLPVPGEVPARRPASRAPAYRAGCGGRPRAWVPMTVAALVLLTVATPLTPPMTALLVVLLVVFARRRRWAGRRQWAGPVGWTTGLDNRGRPRA